MKILNLEFDRSSSQTFSHTCGVLRVEFVKGRKKVTFEKKENFSQSSESLSQTF